MDQAKELRLMKSIMDKDVMNTSGTLKITSITGGKGGVGKSNLALNLSIALSKLGEKVCLMDADLGLANIDVLLGVKPKYNISHVLSNEKKLSEILFNGPFNIKIIPAASGLRQLADLSESALKNFNNQAKDLAKYFDRLIIDTPAGISHNIMTFLMSSSEIIVITTPEPTSITDAYALIKTYRKENGKGKIMFIMNMCSDENEGIKISDRFKQISKHFLGTVPEYIGTVINDRKMVQAIRMQKPLFTTFPESKASIQIEACAKKIKSIESEENDLGNFFNSIKDFIS